METPEQEPAGPEQSPGGMNWATIAVIVFGAAVAISIPMLFGGSSPAPASSPASATADAAAAAPAQPGAGESGETGVKQAQAELYDLSNLEKLLAQKMQTSSRNRYAEEYLRAGFSADKDKYGREEHCLKQVIKCNYCLRSAGNADDLAAQLSDTCDLRDTESDLLTWLQDFDDHFRDVLAANGLPEVAFATGVAYARRNLHIDVETTRWNARHQQTRDAITRFDFLQKNWGQWQLRDGAIVFQDAALRSSHAQMLQTLAEDEKSVETTYKAYMDDLPFKLVEPDDAPSP